MISIIWLTEETVVKVTMVWQVLPVKTRCKQQRDDDEHWKSLIGQFPTLSQTLKECDWFISFYRSLLSVALLLGVRDIIVIGGLARSGVPSV